MDTYSKSVEIRWSDLDPNFHLRHSAYYDFGAFCRIAYLADHGMTAAVMQEQHTGPVIFREECIFKKEIHFGDDIRVNIKLDKCTTDYSRWTMKHEIWKTDDILCAVITVEGAWIDTVQRKLKLPGSHISNIMASAPRTASFEMVSAKIK